MFSRENKSELIHLNLLKNFNRNFKTNLKAIQKLLKQISEQRSLLSVFLGAFKGAFLAFSKELISFLNTNNFWERSGEK